MGADAPERAGDAVMAAVGAIAARIRELEPEARADEPDAVHQLRTHVRRLRSVLAAYRPLFDEARVEHLRRAYREFGADLGVVRDLEVRVGFAEEALDGFAGETAAMRDRLVDGPRVEYGVAHARLVELMDGARAVARAAELEAFCADPPFAPGADAAAVPALNGLLASEAKRAVRRARAADDSLERLHRARKAARRLRYAAEAVSAPPAEVLGDAARELGAAGERIHDLLGDQRDALVFARHARRAGAHAAHHGETAEGYDRLASAAESTAARHLAEFPDAAQELRRARDRFAKSIG
ncbi:hypothetical protein ARHIZOSPH14_33860 [Agromyces rhizosphaerae]|uniref:CHAD domain-containing protein n=1 Tax=Agromyces rhizosphaerae TaxID=88374 RepID=A0A9W6FQJ8_9MICO|nr:CHAD domain-containing protein [Agromyces rhizosphaerae]GLI29144.1 hypothetical protein ARHIZOSPH14_33860 [Agromyces rhizosphaerae]